LEQSDFGAVRVLTGSRSSKGCESRTLASPCKKHVSKLSNAETFESLNARVDWSLGEKLANAFKSAFAANTDSYALAQAS